MAQFTLGCYGNLNIVFWCEQGSSWQLQTAELDDCHLWGMEWREDRPKIAGGGQASVPRIKPSLINQCQRRSSGIPPKPQVPPSRRSYWSQAACEWVHQGSNYLQILLLRCVYIHIPFTFPFYMLSMFFCMWILHFMDCTSCLGNFH